MRPLKHAFCLLSLLGLGAACGGASTPAAASAPPGSTLAAPPSDTCAGDPWLAQILGQRPLLTNTMRLAQMQHTRAYGSYFVSKNNVEMDHIGEFEKMPFSSAEVYEWQGPPNTSSSSGHETARVIVLRNVFGDPRALKADGADEYLAPIALANGVAEYPPAPANVNAPFGPSGGQTIFTFADGTWVRVDGWMVQRFRAAFSAAGQAPPLPPSGSDVAWEVCALFDPNEAQKSGVWGIAPERGVLRFVASSDIDAEMVYRFSSADFAARAQAEQRARCTR
ncbi:MAG: hypothetical protein ACREJX_14205, partial [Polyangiaceae bacterium]